MLHERKYQLLRDGKSAPVTPGCRPGEPEGDPKDCCSSQSGDWRGRHCFSLIFVSFGYRYFKRFLVLCVAKRGESIEEIAKDLSKQQKTTPVLHSYQWTVHAIGRILKNETYTGNFLWQKSFRTSTLPRHYKINRGEKQKYLALHSHPEIIDQDMFQQVQTLLNKRKEKFFTAEIKQSPLRGYLECGCCGSAFRTRTTRGIIYHVCRTHDAGKELCQNRQIPEFTIQGISSTVL